jgi:hypothetical protein
VSKCMSYLAAPAQYLQNWSTAVTTDYRKERYTSSTGIRKHLVSHLLYAVMHMHAVNAFDLLQSWHHAKAYENRALHRYTCTSIVRKRS